MENLSFEQVASILLEVQSNPELQQLALKECESLYSEIFVGHNSEFKGSDIIAYGCSDKSDYSQYLEDLFCSNKRFEHCLNSCSGNKIEAFKLYNNIIINEEKYYLREQLIGRLEYFTEHDEDYIEEDEDGHGHIESIEKEIEALGELAEPVNYFDEELFSKEFDELFEQFKETQYVILVNYKGEGEGEALKIDSFNYRTFYSKYDYS